MSEKNNDLTQFVGFKPDELIAYAVNKYDIKLDKNDPLILLLDLNTLVIKQVYQELVSPLHDISKDLESKAKKLSEIVPKIEASKDFLVAEIALKAKNKVEEDMANTQKKQSMLFACLFFVGGAALGVLLTLTYSFI